MEIPDELKNVLKSDPEILGGTPCFDGTRVPVETFLDYIGSGYSLERFLLGFPSVNKDQAMSVLEWQSTESKHSMGLEIAS
ncbi:MAG: DUF433 domain-containing protein [Armatimonadota bacterium]